MCDQVLKDKTTVQRYMPLVRRIAQHLLVRLPSSVQIDDLMQAGMMGLLEATKNFDADKGASFETYAGIRIRGSMLDEMRKGDWVPRSVHRNTRRISAAVRVIENLIGREARDVEVAEQLDLSLAEYHRMLQASNGTRIYGFEEIGLKDDIMSEGLMHGSDPFMEPLDRLQKEDFKKNLSAGISTLPEKERLVLSMYYEEELNLRQVGEVLGVSESRVCQIHLQAMRRLKLRLKEWTV